MTNVQIKQHDLGNRGGELITDGDDEVAGDWYMITSLDDATAFDTLTGTIASAGDMTALPAGVTIYGQFSAIDLSGGEVIAYNR